MRPPHPHLTLALALAVALSQAEDDLAADRHVYEEDVRDWCHGEGGVMPYLETSFVGNAADSYKAAQRVFRTLVLAEARTKS